MNREFVSYPKSGRSWIRYMLFLSGHAKEVRFHHDGFEFNDGSKPPLDFDVDRRLRRYGEADRVVYLERDPRDVMVSLYYQVVGRFRDYFNYRGSISDFIRDPYFGAENLARFRSVWDEVLADRGFMKVTYEAFHADTAASLQGVLDYLHLPVDRAALDGTVAAASLGRMREVEEAGTFPEPWLRKRNGEPKVRRGEVGGFRGELHGADIEYLDQVFGVGDQPLPGSSDEGP